MLYVFIMSVLQIVTESLPVSSSGNCSLVTRLLNVYTAVKTCPISTDIDFLLHGAALLIMGIYFFSSLVWFAGRITTDYMIIAQHILLSGVAASLTAFCYLFKHTYPGVSISLSTGFFITGLLLSSLYAVRAYGPVRNNKSEAWTFFDACLLGVMQGIALLPGISRLASTFVLGRWLGFSAYRSLVYSCMIEAPLIGAAFLKGLWGVVTTSYSCEIPTFFIMAGVGVIFAAMICSYMLFSWTTRLMESNKIAHFCWYLFFLSGVSYWHGW